MSTVLDYYYSDPSKWPYIIYGNKRKWKSKSVYYLAYIILITFSSSTLLDCNETPAKDSIKFQLRKSREALLSTTKLLS